MNEFHPHIHFQYSHFTLLYVHYFVLYTFDLVVDKLSDALSIGRDIIHVHVRTYACEPELREKSTM